MTEVFGFAPSYSQLGAMIGQPKNSAHYWFNALPQRHVIAFLALLERLPDARRKAIINEFCRELPSFENPRLAHDPLAISHLENVLQQKHGLAWITGGTEFQRTFLITALGHSLPIIRGEHSILTGIDIHEPRKWVPVGSLFYFKSPASPKTLQRLIAETWPVICRSKASVVLLNGVWVLNPELHQNILGQSQERHVILSVNAMPQITPLDGPVSIITITDTRENERWLKIRVETADL